MDATTITAGTLDPALLAFLNFGPTEMLIVIVVGILIFGRRFPEVGRSIAKTLTEFRRGVDKLRTEVDIDRDLSEAKESLKEVNREVLASARGAYERWTDEDPMREETEETEETFGYEGAEEGEDRGEEDAAPADECAEDSAEKPEEGRGEAGSAG